jgi:hypothetical protein
MTKFLALVLAGLVAAATMSACTGDKTDSADTAAK